MEYSFIESKLVATQTRNDTINKYGSIQEIRCQPTTTFYIRECMCHDDIYIYIYINIYIYIMYRTLLVICLLQAQLLALGRVPMLFNQAPPYSQPICVVLFVCCCWRQHSIVVMVLKNQVMDSFQQSMTLTLPLYFILCSIGSTNDHNQTTTTYQPTPQPTPNQLTHSLIITNK